MRHLALGVLPSSVSVFNHKLHVVITYLVYCTVLSLRSQLQKVEMAILSKGRIVYRCTRTYSRINVFNCKAFSSGREDFIRLEAEAKQHPPHKDIVDDQ